MNNDGNALPQPGTFSDSNGNNLSSADHPLTTPRDLIVPVNGIYFDQIAAGTKSHEFRLQTPFWTKRLEGRTYRHVVMTRGYPKGGGVEGETRLTRVWRGYDLRTIQHEHFGADPVAVFAIDVSEAAV